MSHPSSLSSTAYTMAKYGMSMCVLGMAEELKSDGIAVNALWPRTGEECLVHTHIVPFPGQFEKASMYCGMYYCMPHIAIATAAVEMLGGDTAVKMSRKPDIMADAAYLILTGDSQEVTGQFFIDDEVLKQHGITNMDQYANVPGQGTSSAVHTSMYSW